MHFTKKIMLSFVASLVFMNNVIAGESSSHSLKSLVAGISAVALTVWTGKKLYDSYQVTKQVEILLGMHINNMRNVFQDSANNPEMLQSIRTMLEKNSSGYIEIYDYSRYVKRWIVKILPDDKCGVCYQQAALLKGAHDDEIVILPCCKKWLCRKDFLKLSKAIDSCPFCRKTPYPQQVDIVSLQNQCFVVNVDRHPKILKFVSLLPDGQIRDVQGQVVEVPVASTYRDFSLETNCVLVKGFEPKFE